MIKRKRTSRTDCRYRAARCRVGWLVLALATAMTIGGTAQGDSAEPLFRTVDLNVGQKEKVELRDGQMAEVTLVSVEPERDHVMGAIRQVRVDVEVNGQRSTKSAGQRAVSIAGDGGRRADRLPGDR